MNFDKVKVGRQGNEAILNYLKDVGADGHSILLPEFLVKMGFEFAFVAQNCHRQKSGKDFKSQLTDNTGKPVPYIDGVYALNFLYAIAHNIGADTTEAMSKMGRGYQAGCLCKAIMDVVGEPIKAEPVLP